MGTPSTPVELRGVALWGIRDRPEAMNALSHEALEMLEQASSQAEDDAVTAVVLTGRGPAFPPAST
jgi:enoyl-CoA hydratase/carnithine racemase